MPDCTKPSCGRTDDGRSKRPIMWKSFGDEGMWSLSIATHLNVGGYTEVMKCLKE